MNTLSPAFKIASIFFIFSFIWIIASDKTIYLFTQDVESLNFIQTIKGWFFISITSLIIYTLVNKYFKKELQLRNDIENIFDQTSAPVAVYDRNGRVLRVNEVWKELTGYTIEDLEYIEQCADISCRNTKEKDLFLSKLYNINQKEDLGEFTINTANNKTLIWNFNCAPYGLDEKNKIIILTAVDITELRKKEKIIIQQSKMAALGEVLENIAHQWRQPLSTISTIATGVKTQKEQNILNEESLVKSMEYINSSIVYNR